MYINNVGWVGASGSTQISAQATSDLSCIAYSAAYGYGSWIGYTYTVIPQPSVSISANPNPVIVGQPSTITATFVPASGDTLTSDTIDMAGASSVIANSTQTMRTYAFTPSSAGTTTFLPYIQTNYFPSWNTFGISVTVTAVANPSCTLSLSPTSVTQGNSSTLSYSSSNASSFSISSVGSETPNTTGSTSVHPSVSTIYTGSATAGGVTNQCSATLAVSCTQSWSCSGQTIVQTNTNCSTTNLSTCVAPQYCQADSSSCLAPAITENPSGNLTGNLQVIPNIVSSGETTKVYWNVSNAQSCTVTGTNGDHWSTASGAQTTQVITGPVTYTLQCTAYNPNPNLSETQSVSVTPKFLEQ
jgi:hypothetical protein